MQHPILANRTRLIIWGLAWLFLGIGQALLYYFAYGRFVNISIADALLSLLIFSGLALSIWYPFNYFTLGKENPLSLILNLLAIGVVSVVLWILISKGILLLLLPDRNIHQEYWDVTLLYRIGTGLFIYMLVILSYFLFVSLSNLSEKKAREAKLESLVKETELKMLRSQINPHFLFNSLNSISSLTISDPDKARDMVIKLSEFMRYALSKKDEQPVTLRSELDNLRLYFDIEKVRFGDRLTTDENIDENCLDTKMPVMLLQPLYENAIKHGVYESTQRVTIVTEAKRTDGHIEIKITNNFESVPSSRKGTGTGLLNVSRRLELYYGKNASIKTTRENDVYSVSLIIPSEV